MVNILNNKEAFLREKPKKMFLIIIIPSILLLLVVLITKFKVYDTYSTKGYSTCNDTCKIVVVIPSSLTFDKIYLNNEVAEYKIVNKQLEVDEENMVSYNKLIIETNKTFKDKEIVNVNFYYNKQRIITKIKEKMF